MVARQLPGGLYFKQWSAAGNEEAGGDGRLTVVKLAWIPPLPKNILQKSKERICCIEITPTFAPPIEMRAVKKRNRKVDESLKISS